MTATKTRVKPEQRFADMLEIDAGMIEGVIERWPGVWEFRTIISPDIAQAWLARNIEHNRAVSLTTVEMYARDMKNGRWHPEVAHAIAFSSDGSLVEGQHRLSACMRSNVELLSTVQVGVPQQAFLAMDAGRKRYPADHLRMKGFPSAGSMAAVAKMYLQVTHGIGRSYQPGTEEIVAFAEARRDHLISSVRKSQQVTQMIGFKRAPLSVAILQAYDQGLEGDMDEFVEQLKTGMQSDGAPVPVNSGTWTLREWQIRQQHLPRGRSTATPTYTYALVLKAWRFWLQNEPVKSLRWRPGEELPEFAG